MIKCFQPRLISLRIYIKIREEIKHRVDLILY
jgi:hypothetical protein